jgi:hypothetical protein
MKSNKRKGIGVTKKTAIGIFVVLISMALVASGAGLLSYYGKIEASAEVSQSVTVDGQNWDEPITHEFDINAGCTEIYKYKITNNACVEAPIDITTDIDGYGKGTDGVNVDYYLMDGWKTLTLENKDPDSDWDVIEDDYYAEFTYNPCCPTLNWELEGTFEANTDYVLIYYADQPERFTNWGGAPAMKIAEFNSGDGNFSESGNMNFGNKCLPMEDDWNIGPDADYVSEDGYVHGKGAKIWLVPESIYDGTDTELKSWVPDEILFETDLMAFFDCSVNPIPNYIETYFDYETPMSGTTYTLQPGEEICLFVEYNFDVATIPGTYDITTTVVPN